MKQLPEGEDPGDVHAAAEALLERLPGLHARVLARLCQMAECVETKLGLPPLEDPDSEPDGSDDSEGE